MPWCERAAVVVVTVACMAGLSALPATAAPGSPRTSRAVASSNEQRFQQTVEYDGVAVTVPDDWARHRRSGQGWMRST